MKPIHFEESYRRLAARREHDFGPWLADLPEFGGKVSERRCRRCGAKQWQNAGELMSYGNERSRESC